MTTAEAIRLVNQYGGQHNMPGFLETIEALDYLSKAPEYIRPFIISDELRMAYNITIGEFENFAGRTGE